MMGEKPNLILKSSFVFLARQCLRNRKRNHPCSQSQHDTCIYLKTYSEPAQRCEPNNGFKSIPFINKYTEKTRRSSPWPYCTRKCMSQFSPPCLYCEAICMPSYIQAATLNAGSRA